MKLVSLLLERNQVGKAIIVDLEVEVLSMERRPKLAMPANLNIRHLEKKTWFLLRCMETLFMNLVE